MLLFLEECDRKPNRGIGISSEYVSPKSLQPAPAFRNVPKPGAGCRQRVQKVPEGYGLH